MEILLRHKVIKHVINKTNIIKSALTFVLNKVLCS